MCFLWLLKPSWLCCLSGDKKERKPAVGVWRQTPALYGENTGFSSTLDRVQCAPHHLWGFDLASLTCLSCRCWPLVSMFAPILWNPLMLCGRLPSSGKPFYPVWSNESLAPQNLPGNVMNREIILYMVKLLKMFSWAQNRELILNMLAVF